MVRLDALLALLYHQLLAIVHYTTIPVFEVRSRSVPEVIVGEAYRR
jgi:hypothetical protein